MDPEDLRDRIADQFAYRGDRADVWRGFDRLLDTGAFLNLGYSPWYLPHVVGSSQRRLAGRIGAELATRLPDDRAAAGRLLDVGCGRGGPAIHLADQLGVPVVGADLVPYNVATAAENARRSDAGAEFVLGDAAVLPLAPQSVTACTAIDALVYVPDRAAVVSEIAAALADGGLLVCSDLLARPGCTDAERRTVAAFADAWDMAAPGTVAEYERLLEDAGLSVRAVEDLTPHSVGRFRKWTALYLALADGPAAPVLERSLRALDLDPAAVTEQVRRAHRALPHLRHGLLVAEKR